HKTSWQKFEENNSIIDCYFASRSAPILSSWNASSKIIAEKKGGVHRLRLDYNKLKSFSPQGLTQNVFEANKNRCRYKVILSWPPGQVNDFIHANWVKHELLENDFICCQAPLESTVGDFWRMIWQEKVKQIIMLCSLFELGKMKCCQYWPPRVDDKMTFFTITITCTLIDTSDPSFVHTKLDLTCWSYLSDLFDVTVIISNSRTGINQQCTDTDLFGKMPIDKLLVYRSEQYNFRRVITKALMEYLLSGFLTLTNRKLIFNKHDDLVAIQTLESTSPRRSSSPSYLPLQYIYTFEVQHTGTDE
uniref:Tyrosine-protein phosphatase domain-containing protein n=1 Tax=Parascaris equorum TaxID=6256 RepID=A0A914S327_PAREQ